MKYNKSNPWSPMWAPWWFNMVMIKSFPLKKSSCTLRLLWMSPSDPNFLLLASLTRFFIKGTFTWIICSEWVTYENWGFPAGPKTCNQKSRISHPFPAGATAGMGQIQPKRLEKEAKMSRWQWHSRFYTLGLHAQDQRELWGCRRDGYCEARMLARP